MMQKEKIAEQLACTLEGTDFPQLGMKYEGKVRDNYTKDGRRIIITTDRISAFDRVLGTIPFKGEILTAMACFWFGKTKDIVKNHLRDRPDPNVMVVQECAAVPVEMVVREYLTGVTTTSIWHHYRNGGRTFCGQALPDGMRKDQKLAQAIVTPSTKAAKGRHDESVSGDEVVKRGLLTRDEFRELSEISLKLFERGKKIAEKQGLILADTKYEFGRKDGECMLIDEVHTPDSSRYWHADSYDELFRAGKEQRKLDKEYVRSWLAGQGFTGSGHAPEIPDEVRMETARRYMEAFELVTGDTVEAETGKVLERIKANLIKNGYMEEQDV